LGNFLSAIMPVLYILLAAAILVLVLFSLSDAFRSGVLSRWQRLSGDKGVFRRISSARFVQALSMGLRSGMSEEESLRLAAGLENSSTAAAARYARCAELAGEGKTLEEILGECDVVPAVFCRMLMLARRSGNLDAVVVEVARRMSRSGAEALERKVSQVEPSLVIISSVLVGAILLSVMLPLMNIMSAIG